VISLPDGYHWLHLPEVDSTNEEARRMAAQNSLRPTWIVADVQTAGRGRRGRVWDSPTGNLMTTLYLPDAPEPKQAGQLAFVAGLALEATVRHFIGAPSPERARVSLKWPNDVLIDGKKASGILLESTQQDKHRRWLAIGLGLNLASHPDDTPYPATNLSAYTSQAPSNLEALEILAAAFERVYQQWKMGGFAPVLQSWRGVAHGIGGPLVARLENQEIKGIFIDIDEKGALLLQDEAGGTQAIDAGDVFFPENG
jgi:BirA family biotin operon repressor/biotin-[acetyl-CoA-carboxylase] ligase